MATDPVSTDTSVSVELTDTGIMANAKSRTVAAFDRLGGNLAELVNVRLERGISRQRTLIEGEQRLLEAVVTAGVEQIGLNPSIAAKVLRSHFSDVFRRHGATSEVLKHSIEELRLDPISPDDAASGPAELDPQFLNKFERLAGDAATEALQAKWGRVLTAEIRKPGTFSPKVLRIVDEIDPDVARRFEELCTSLLANIVPRALTGELEFSDRALNDAGLLVDFTGHGQIRRLYALKGRSCGFSI